MSITGAEQLEALGRRMAIAAIETRTGVQEALLKAAPILVEGARRNARTRLPKQGGLNTTVAASAFVIQSRQTVLGPGVRIGTGSNRGSNRGVIRHPVYGRRATWVAQPYEPGRGWFDDAMNAGRPAVEAAVKAALAATSAKVTKGG